MSVLQSFNAQETNIEEIDALNVSPVRHPATAIDRHPFRAFFALTGFYFVVVLTLSSFKLLWLDELITLHIARLSGPSAI